MKLAATFALLGLLFLTLFDSAGGPFISLFSRKWARLSVGEAFIHALLVQSFASELRSEILPNSGVILLKKKKKKEAPLLESAEIEQLTGTAGGSRGDQDGRRIL